MKLSIVIAVLNSPEMVRRQCLHFQEMPLSLGVEVVLVDDGSTPPLSRSDYGYPWLRVLRHDVDGDWTQPAARNFGVRHSFGEYILCTDIDHIITRELISTVLYMQYDVVRFKREVAILDQCGEFVQTEAVVKEYGYEDRRFKSRGFRIAPHTNSFAMRRQLYLDLGGVSEKKVGSGVYPNREEQPLKRAFKRKAAAGDILIIPDDERPTIYMVPNGRYCGEKDYNPFGLFHDLKR